MKRVSTSRHRQYVSLTYDVVAYWDVTAEDLDQRPHRDFMDVLKDHIHKNGEG